jgi:hypothetical protein
MKITFRCDPAWIDLLPRPVAAREALPDWLRALAPRAMSPVHQRSIRTVKQCPPFVDAMSHGFMILLPCDVTVGDGRFDWDWPLPPPAARHQPRAPLSFHVPQQLEGSPFARGTQVAIKFNSFWTIELEPGWSLMATHPIHREDLPFRTVTGLVDADRFCDAGINFPAIWTDPAFRGVLPRGTPVAQCFAVPRDVPELVCEAMDAAHLERFDALAGAVMAEPGVYRKRYRHKRKVPGEAG